MGAMYESNMQRYAADQVDLGERLRAEHGDTDLPGICMCGRQSPCDERVRGDDLVGRYGSLAEPASRTVRPYVPYGTNAGRW